jgi:flagellar protein FlaG
MQITAIDPAIPAAPAATVAPLPPIAGQRAAAAALPRVAIAGAGEGQAPGATSLEDAASRLERYVQSVGRALQFRVDQNSGHVVVSVRDPSTGELIRQIPSEAALKIAEQLGSADSPVSSVIIDGLA